MTSTRKTSTRKTEPDTHISHPDPHGPDYVRFFKQRRWVRSDFERRFPHLDYLEELEQVASGTTFNQRIKDHARQIVDRLEKAKTEAMDQTQGAEARAEAESIPSPITNNLIRPHYNGPVSLSLGHQSSGHEVHEVHGSAYHGRTLNVKNVTNNYPSGNDKRTRGADNDEEEGEGEAESSHKRSRQAEGVGAEEILAIEEEVQGGLPQDNQASPEADILLPSGSYLLMRLAQHNPDDTCYTGRGILFIDRPWISSALSPDDLDFLKAKFPAIPPVPEFFDLALEACRPSLTNPRHWPVPPPFTSDEDMNIWHYVSTAVMHFALNFPKIASRSPTHAEVWADVNIWGTLWDYAFLKSPTLTLDRKELRIALKNITIRHDGIIRSALPSCGRNLGFLEVKPERHNSGDSTTMSDRNKVLASMCATLRCHKVPGVVVTGIICHGLRMTILRGTMLEGGVFMFKEMTEVVHPRRILGVVKCCWSVRAALEESYERIVDAIPGADLL